MFLFLFVHTIAYGLGVVIVDKKTSQLHLAEITPQEFRITKTLHATLGKVPGDKAIEGDLKTPEGIYTLTTKLTSGLPAKLGIMAFPLNYPNDFDEYKKKTGSQILLHGTNFPERLKKDFDSEGCIVIPNEEITKIEDDIKTGLTQILVFENLAPQFLRHDTTGPLAQFFEKWRTSWESKQIDSYIGSYHTSFRNTGRDLAQYRAFKAALNQKYETIQVQSKDVIYYRHPKYSIISFTQAYRSTHKNGSSAKTSLGTKFLTVVEEEGKFSILAENFTERVWPH